MLLVEAVAASVPPQTPEEWFVASNAEVMSDGDEVPPELDTVKFLAALNADGDVDLEEFKAKLASKDDPLAMDKFEQTEMQDKIPTPTNPQLTRDDGAGEPGRPSAPTTTPTESSPEKGQARPLWGSSPPVLEALAHYLRSFGVKRRRSNPRMLCPA